MWNLTTGGRALIAILISGVLGLSHVARAGEEDAAGETPGHILHGVHFMPSYVFPNPFAVPTFEFDLGFGHAEFAKEFLFTTRDLNIGLLGPKLEAQIKLMKGLVLIVGAEGTVTFGVNTESIIAYGGSVRYRPRLGLLWEVLRTERQVLSLGFEWEKPVIIEESPGGMVLRRVSSFLGGPEIPGETNTKVTRWRPTVRYALALSPMIGVAAYGGINFNSENINNVESGTTEFQLGANFTVDFHSLWRVPLGLSASYRYSDLFGSPRDPAHYSTIGVFENFSKRYNFGIEVGRQERGQQWATTGAFVSRYYY